MLWSYNWSGDGLDIGAFDDYGKLYLSPHTRRTMNKSNNTFIYWIRSSATCLLETSIRLWYGQMMEENLKSDSRNTCRYLLNAFSSNRRWWDCSSWAHIYSRRPLISKMEPTLLLQMRLPMIRLSLSLFLLLFRLTSSRFLSDKVLESIQIHGNLRYLPSAESFRTGIYVIEIASRNSLA